MKIASGKHRICLDLKENQIINLIIENRNEFADIIRELCLQINGQEGSFVLSHQDTILTLSKYADFISNPVMVDCNEKRVINALYKELDEIVKEQMVPQKNYINSQILNFLQEVQNRIPYHTDFGTDIDILGIFKIYNIHIDSDVDSIIDKFVDYIRALHQICKVEVFFVLNLKFFFSDEELNELYKICNYEKISLINIEGMQTKALKGEKQFIIDKDLCIIDI